MFQHCASVGNEQEVPNAFSLLLLTANHGDCEAMKLRTARMSVYNMGFLDKMCDAILGENQSESDNYNYYNDNHRNDYSRGDRRSDRVRVSWRGYYRSTDGGVHEAVIDEIIPEATWYRLSGSCELTKQFLMRMIFDCVELENSAPILHFEEYV